VTVGLNADELLASATADTGLTDYADPTLPERFAVAVDHLNSLGMDAAGIAAAAQVCRWLLTSRLEFIEDRDRYPIADEVIDAPMFVTGEPRSGTTLMHAMMSVDPEARALRFWEVMYPSPPPGLRIGRRAARTGRRRLARDQRQDAQVAAQPPLQRHARRRPT